MPRYQCIECGCLFIAPRFEKNQLCPVCRADDKRIPAREISDSELLRLFEEREGN